MALFHCGLVSKFLSLLATSCCTSIWRFRGGDIEVLSCGTAFDFRSWRVPPSSIETESARPFPYNVCAQLSESKTSLSDHGDFRLVFLGRQKSTSVIAGPFSANERSIRNFSVLDDASASSYSNYREH